MSRPPFDAIYVINLAHRDDRRREMRREIGRVSHFIDPGLFRFWEVSPPDGAGGFPSVGARGCFESHLGLLKDALLERSGDILILEDDCDFPHPALMQRAFEHLARLDHQWDMFYGGYRLPADFRLQETRPLTVLAADVPLQTSHCIGLSRRTVEAAVPYFEQMFEREPGSPEGGPMHVDGAYSWLRRSLRLQRTMLATPPIAVQRSSLSDVSESMGNRGLIRGAKALATPLRRRIQGLLG